MSTRKEHIKISDCKGFVHCVLLEHKPHFGFTTAYNGDRIIGQVELGRILEPLSDNDSEWEMYEERFSEWSDEVKSNIEIICKQYFDAELQKNLGTWLFRCQFWKCN